MSEQITILEGKTVVELTPELMAKAFWNMNSEQQADFFEHLAAAVESTKGAYSFGEGQWWHLHNDLQKRKGKGLQMYLALSVFAFDIFQGCGLRQKSFYSDYASA